MTAPRLGLNREEAAAAVGVSANVFDRMVDAGELPKPHRSRVTKRLIWLVSELELAIGELPTGDEVASEFAGVEL